MKKQSITNSNDEAGNIKTNLAVSSRCKSNCLHLTSTAWNYMRTE